MKIKLYVKKVPTYLDTTNFIQEYQDITKEFMKKVQKVQTNKDKLTIEKLISMHSCLNMDAYNKDLIQNDIEELLKINQVQTIETKEYDPFDPNIHELRKPLYDNYLNYYVKEVIEEGFIQKDKVLKKAIVEIERRDLDE